METLLDKIAATPSAEPMGWCGLAETAGETNELSEFDEQDWTAVGHKKNPSVEFNSLGVNYSNTVARATAVTKQIGGATATGPKGLLRRRESPGERGSRIPQLAQRDRSHRCEGTLRAAR